MDLFPQIEVRVIPFLRYGCLNEKLLFVLDQQEGTILILGQYPWLMIEITFSLMKCGNAVKCATSLNKYITKIIIALFTLLIIAHP